MGVISGIDAAVKYDSTVVGCASYWQITGSAIDNVAACSGTDGAVARGTPNEDWQGYYAAYGYLPALFPSTTFQFLGTDREGQGWQSAASGAIVEQVRIIWPIEQGDLIYHRVDFAGTGSLSAFSGSAAVDSALPNPPSVQDLTLSWGATEITDLGYIELILKGNNTKPKWTSTSSGWPKRVAGNLDAEVIWKHYFDASSQIPAITSGNAIVTIKATAALNWVLKWCQISDYKPVYDIKGENGVPELVGAVVRAKFTGWSAGAKGYISKPTDPVTYLWGTA